MMCTYGLNYQSIVYLCYQSAGPTESESHEKVKERKKNKKKNRGEAQMDPLKFKLEQMI